MKKAFTLIELMIVIAIIALIASIAIPNMLSNSKAINYIGVGDFVQIKSKSLHGRVVNNIDLNRCEVRIYNGVEGKEPYNTVIFFKDELEKTVEK